MINDIRYHKNERHIIDVERAMTEIRRGAMILLTHGERASLTLAIETVTEQELERFAELVSEFSLVITSKRAGHIFAPELFDHDIVIDAAGRKLEELKTISGLYAPQDTPLNPASYVFAAANPVAMSAIRLNKIAELVPSALIATLDKTGMSKEALLQWAERNGVLHLAAESLASYQENISTTLIRACDAPLCLTHAEQTHITAFRPMSGGKEHYAIVIGTPSVDDVPIVRIHSSCYTGDLLGSLRCDCGDQLRSAIEFMGKNPQGGIIIYLMQEGRGIGLTNKLRTYALQETGIDTVDANEMLGFDDDERLFQPAAEILKQMGYNKVRLLTNNFRKSKGLEEYGITVTECVPHIMQAHQHNDVYLKTKANRLGHTLPK